MNGGGYDTTSFGLHIIFVHAERWKKSRENLEHMWLSEAGIVVESIPNQWAVEGRSMKVGAVRRVNADLL